MSKKETFFVIDGIRYDFVRDPEDVDLDTVCRNCALSSLCDSLSVEILCQLFNPDFHFEIHK